MAKFEYNWATAEMVKLYLRNSHAQIKHKACNASGSLPPDTTPAGVDPGAGANSGSIGATAGTGGNGDSSSDDDTDEN